MCLVNKQIKNWYNNAPNDDTNQSGVLPSMVSALVEAPLSTRCLTTSKWPAFAAQWSGVHPSYIQKGLYFYHVCCKNNLLL